jgi:hypothetical protein
MAGEVPDLQGIYVLDRAASDNIDAAIEQGTAEMNFAIRYVARGRIAKTNPLYQRVQISRAAGTVSVRFDAAKPIDIPTDGRSVAWTRQDGGKYDITAESSATKLVMHLRADDGERTNTFMLSPEGAQLELEVTLVSSRLPHAIDYKLGFRRQAHE